MDTKIDQLVYSAVFGSETEKEAARKQIKEMAAEKGIFPASIHDFYMIRSQGKFPKISVPAINIRAASYYTARAAMRAANKLKVKSVIFEIARSEIKYTAQRPSEFTAVMLAAAIKENFIGPLFIQGDHYQFDLKKYQVDPQTEMQAIKDLITESVTADFYNIDIDASTLVDLTQNNVDEQQKTNYLVTAELTKLIREIEPQGLKISVGGEIGHIGGKNSNPEELKAFLNGYKTELQKDGKNLIGLSKVSVQTGTTHGGVVLADGTLAQVKIDFETLEKMSDVCQEYGLGGAVQHGASTLPDEAFDQFPKRDTLEVHLATGFQNILYDHPQFPVTLKKEIYQYLKENCSKERKEGMTEEQFNYSLRKKALGPFKKQLWEMGEKVWQEIGKTLENKFTLLYQKLNVVNSREMINNVIKKK